MAPFPPLRILETVTRVIIVGAGKGGRALLEMFAGDPTISILGVADVNPWAPGIEFARRIGAPVATDFREIVRDTQADLIIDVTGSADVHKAIHALKSPTTEVMGGLGARFMWDLLAVRKKAEELEDRYSLVVRELQAQAETEFIVGRNAKMQDVGDAIARVAASGTPVLVRGEPGTGKELVARAVHRYSSLRDKPLLTVNCTALTPVLIESELFGHRRGTAAGASGRVGLLEKADGGTIFLDEIGDVPLDTQAKLLRVLQAGEVRPAGEAVTRRVRTRMIAATNRDLEAAVQRGEFREDLFTRLSACTIALPPLRERTEDIPILAYHFLQKAEAKVNKKVERIADDALDILKRYSWPGNLRELEHIIERAVVVATGRSIDAMHLPLHLHEPSTRGADRAGGILANKGRMVREFEREAIARLLGETRGNVSVAARLAGTTRRNFHRLLVKHGIDPARYRAAV